MLANEIIRDNAEFQELLNVCCIIATIVGAITGATASSRVRMDIFGIIVCGMIVALGGGTLRDFCLSGVVNPATGMPVTVYWTNASDVQYLYYAFGTSAVVFYVTRFWSLPTGTIRVADAFSMAFFTLLGMSKAFDLGLPWVVCVIMGVLTGVAGGMVRDVLTGNVPYIFRPKEVYATASVCGCFSFLAMVEGLGMPETWSFILSVLVTVMIRMVSVYLNWRLPSYRPLFDTLHEDEGAPPHRDGEA